MRSKTKRVVVGLKQYQGQELLGNAKTKISTDHKIKGFSEVVRIVKALLFGVGVEGNANNIGLLRHFLNQPRIFKIAARFFMWRWPHDAKKLRETLDFSGNPHLEDVFEYTVYQSEVQVTTGSGRRAEKYYQIISLPPRDKSDEKLLIVGGKDVVELFLAWLHGFEWKNIHGIDLFSLHPKIEVMDMESMDFPDNHFDAVTMANVYGYQLNPTDCLKEIARVLKPGGRFAFNTSYSPSSVKSQFPCYHIKVDKMASILKDCGFELVCHIAKEGSAGDTSHVWGLQKDGPERPGMDRLSWG